MTSEDLLQPGHVVKERWKVVSVPAATWSPNYVMPMLASALTFPVNTCITIKRTFTPDRDA